ncbi:ABC transporter permease [Nocardia sp. CDC159]|uniref:ABC transporter permease n=1 Tax=Nocardia pulmonis TaxID=2951408 RepID=A0A9X2E6V1_9NOCA|nr:MULTISPECIES: ABC transporter permease [Nocardia]MCM6774725.1 ABC transporter permease [Nocardia pulmonis]MCM6787210.1 ABC transporter permease [Nocardia sp. CDC159]
MDSRMPRMGAAWIWRWAVLAVGLGLWEVWARGERSPFFPPPTRIAAQMYRLWFSGPVDRLFLTQDAIDDILPSLARIVAGFTIATVIGIVAGIAIARSPVLADYLDPILQFCRALPVVALVPVFLAFLKIGTQMEVVTIAFGSVWPVLLNTADGVASVDPLKVDTARAFRLSPRERLTALIIPAALPKIFAGMRIGVSISLILMVISELVGATEGIGYALNNASTSFDLPSLWAAIALLGILGYLLNGLLLLAERRLLSWHHGAYQRAP